MKETNRLKQNIDHPLISIIDKIGKSMKGNKDAQKTRGAFTNRECIIWGVSLSVTRNDHDTLLSCLPSSFVIQQRWSTPVQDTNFPIKEKRKE